MAIKGVCCLPAPEICKSEPGEPSPTSSRFKPETWGAGGVQLMFHLGERNSNSVHLPSTALQAPSPKAIALEPVLDNSPI